MKVSINWLREFVPSDLSAEALAERLTHAGLAVDAVTSVGRFERILSARIAGIERHPGAERLRLCTVDAGAAGTLRVVSGAPGLEAGACVALALPGARLADGRTVEALDIRGVVSAGNLVSELEVGISEQGAGVMHFGADVAAGTPLADILGTADTILDVDVTPNRGDCLSILGIAREVAALTGVRLRDRAPRLTETGPAAADRVRVEIRDPDLCPRYVARVVTRIEIAPSPLWMRARLESLGVRAINNVVDVTNYVMLERGQPLHAFDLERLAGPAIIVRRAGDSRRFRTLDGAERELERDDLVIADAECPVAIAGVMGGEETAVEARTREILIESACFAPAAIRRTSRRLGLRSESSVRFERSVDVEGAAMAADRAAELCARVARGEVAPGRADVYPAPVSAAEVLVRTERVNRLLGTSLAVSEVGQSLRRVSASVKAAGRGGFLCRPPSHRSDLTREADFIEEVARLSGYDRIPETLPHAPISAAGAPQRLERTVRALLVAAGMTEMVSFKFVAAHWNRRIGGLSPADGVAVDLVNPLSADVAEMRRSLVPGLLLSALRNHRQGEAWVRAFEVGTAFWRDAAGRIEERPMIAGILRGVPPPHWGAPARGESFYDAKGAVETLLEALHATPLTWRRGEGPPFLHPGKSATVWASGELLGYVGGVHPEIAKELDLPGDSWVFELDFKKVGLYASRRTRFQPLPKYPAVVRDLAIVADEGFEAQAVLDVIAGCSNLPVEDASLFDVYRGSPLPSGKKSLAYSIAYRAADRTLTDDEVNELHRRLVGEVVRRLGVEPRS